MKERLRQVLLAAAFLAIAALAYGNVLGQEGTASELPPEMRVLINEVRVATAPYADLDTALDAGYGKFLGCFRHGEDLGMGQHYVHGELVGDDVLDPLAPEALVYAPLPDGEMALIAMEYLVFQDAWDPEGTGREAPVLFDREMSLKTNIPDTPPVYALHLWLWSHNPEGMFADYNPTVFCPEDGPVVEMADR